MPANGFGFFTCFLLRRLFEMPAEFHLTENTFTLHLFLQRAQCLIDIVIAYDNLHSNHPLSGSRSLVRKGVSLRRGALIPCLSGNVKGAVTYRGLRHQFPLTLSRRGIIVPSMSILKIARMGHPVLTQTADPVADPQAAEIHRLVADMVETMQDAGGTGLAAPQVHETIRLVVYFVKAGRGAGASLEDIPLTVLVNPEITPIGAELVYDWEGCLSVPGLTGLVPRHDRIALRHQTLAGEMIETELTGFHARVVQHECDHLDGILYPQRMDDLSLLMFSEEMRHGMPEAARKLMEKNHEPAG